MSHPARMRSGPIAPVSKESGRLEQPLKTSTCANPHPAWRGRVISRPDCGDINAQATVVVFDFVEPLRTGRHGLAEHRQVKLEICRLAKIIFDARNANP